MEGMFYNVNFGSVRARQHLRAELTTKAATSKALFAGTETHC